MKIKQLLLVSYFLGCCSIINGQAYAVDKGATFISGMGSFTSQGGDLFEDDDNNRGTTVTLSPSFNHFVTKNFFIGGGFDLSHQAQGDFSVNSIGIGPQIGYAIGNSNSTAFPYFNAGLRYYSISTDYQYAAGTDVFLGFGIIIPVKTHLGLAIETSYHMFDLENSDTNASSSGNVISIGIGIVGLLF